MVTMKNGACLISFALSAALVTAGCGDTQPEPEVSPTPQVSTAERTQPSSEPEQVTMGGSPDAPENSFRSIDEIPRVTVSELQDLIAQDAVQIVDVRSGNAYITEHIPGSINIPAMEITQRIDELDMERAIVTYCT